MEHGGAHGGGKVSGAPIHCRGDPNAASLVWPPVQAMLQGVIPATAGIMFTLAIQFALQSRNKELKQVSYLRLKGVVILGAVRALISVTIPPLPLLALATALGYLLYRLMALGLLGIGACPASSVVLSLKRGNRCGLVSPLVRNNTGCHVACERLGRMSDS